MTPYSPLLQQTTRCPRRACLAPPPSLFRALPYLASSCLSFPLPLSLPPPSFSLSLSLRVDAFTVCQSAVSGNPIPHDRRRPVRDETPLPTTGRGQEKSWQGGKACLLDMDIQVRHINSTPYACQAPTCTPYVHMECTRTAVTNDTER